MSKINYECELAGVVVQVAAEKVLLEDKTLGATRLYPILKYCSHIGTSDCSVCHREDSLGDVKGVPFSGTDHCSYLVSLGRHD